jgi:tetratricopeptide (TPR) repeat protein
MRAIFVVPILATLSLVGLADANLSSAFSQRSRQAPSASQPASPAEPDRRFPDPNHQSRIDQLFERLAAARDEAESAALVEQIERIWRRSGSDTIDLLMSRAQTASGAQDGILSLDIMDSVIALKPDWAEVYNRRAAILFQLKDFDGAMRDLRQTLALEPRQFQALAGVGMIFQQGGKAPQALAAFREALKLNPHFKGIKQAADKLSIEHDGQNL